MRIGIWSVKDIQSDEPLSYDYQFDTNEQDIFKCYCNSENCRGTMAPKKKSDLNVKNLSRVERQRLVAQGRQRERQMQEDAMSLKNLRHEEWSRCCYASRLLPGDNFLEVIRN
jgi:hypothetical protein